MLVKVHKWKDVQKKHFTPAQIAASKASAEQATFEMNLSKLRELTGKTQVEVAHLVEMTQSELSRAERRDDHLVSTLRRYVEALGGRLEVVAVFDDKQVKLSGV
jgi:predicted transcriptional regulator